MKKIFCVFILATCSLFIFTACTKAGGDTPDDPNQVDQNDDIFPVITINKPTANQVYVSGDSIIVEGKATDERTLYKGKVQLKNDLTGTITAEQFFETHFLQLINFRLAYKSMVTASTDFTVIVEFQDHGLNTSNSTLKVKVNP